MIFVNCGMEIGRYSVKNKYISSTDFSILLVRLISTFVSARLQKSETKSVFSYSLYSPSYVLTFGGGFVDNSFI